MADDTYQFENVATLTAGSEGVPGKRTFYMLVGAGGTLVRAWLEKEQLETLGLAVEELVTGQLREIASITPKEKPKPEGPEEQPAGEITDEFRVGRVALGYDSSQGKVVILLYDIEELAGAAEEEQVEQEEPEEEPKLLCHVSRDQAGKLSARIATIVAAGRPICPLCHSPIDPSGHWCARSNGHRSTELE